jgi:ribonucleoside-diphosphate reductase alpha subunit
MSSIVSKPAEVEDGMVSYVVKRDGRHERVIFDKITARITKLAYGLNTRFVDPVRVAQKVCSGVHKGVTTAQLDELAAETAAHLSSLHYDYGLLAARIEVSNLHKQTEKVFSVVAKTLKECINPKTGQPGPLLSDRVYDFIVANKDRLNAAIVYDRDYMCDYFGFKTLERSYLLKVDGKIVERRQHEIMRVACEIDMPDVDRVIENYNLMSLGFFTPATPTLFNAGTPNHQMSSCFLLKVKADSIKGIYDTLGDCALTSKSAGGIGMAISHIRASGSYIRGTNGVSNGLIPMLRVFNATARYVDQGGGKRKGAIATYLEPWHADIFAYLDLRKNHGNEEERCRDLSLGLWIPDLFMERVEADQSWSLFCPNEAPGLDECHSEKFSKLYEKYEGIPGKARQTIPARKVWQAILDSQVETGYPYMLYKDAANSKSNQQHLGTISQSNLCCEVIEYTAPDEIAVCNLSSIALPKFVKMVMQDGEELRVYDFESLRQVAYRVCVNLNKVIDLNDYPTVEARNSNLRHRPIGIGVQGMAEAFILMRYPYDSEEAGKLDKDIFETIYYGAMQASIDLAVQHGPYQSFEGSPLSHGKFQFDLWDEDGHTRQGYKRTAHSGMWGWSALRARVVQHGARNSLLMAPMPTASTSQILGNTEAFEPLNSNLYVRRTLAGEFVCVNRHFQKDMIDLGLWDEALKNKLVANKGSVKYMKEVPAHLRALYKTVWEISQKVIVDRAAARGRYVCQSQSLNLHVTDINFGKLTSMHFYSWKAGLKTGMYYLRSRAATDAIAFTVDPSMVKAANDARRHASINEGVSMLSLDPKPSPRSADLAEEEKRQSLPVTPRVPAISILRAPSVDSVPLPPPEATDTGSPGGDSPVNTGMPQNRAPGYGGVSAPYDAMALAAQESLEEMKLQCRRDNQDECQMCGS